MGILSNKGVLLFLAIDKNTYSDIDLPKEIGTTKGIKPLNSSLNRISIT